MTRIWTPVDHLRKTPCSCDNCTNSYGMEEPIERFVGKWWRLQMPWQAQPSEEVDGE